MTIDPSTRAKIITLKNYTSKSISEISRIVCVDRHSVRRIIKANEEQGRRVFKKRGPRHKINGENLDMLLRHSQENPCKSSFELRNYLEQKGILVSDRTVRRHLVSSGRKARRPIKKQLLTAKMKERRLEWAMMYQDWKKEDWQRVLFSDEVQFHAQGQSSQWVRRSKGEAITQKHIRQVAKFPQKVMFWGSFSYNGVGSLLPIEGTMNADKYIKVVHDKIKEDMMDAFPANNGIFQQDLAPCHRAKKVTRSFAKNKIEVLFWPGNSPDLNPIENLWSIVKSEQKKRDSGTKDKLTQVVIDIWFNNTNIPQYCKTLVDSMPSRVQQLIKNNGGHINY